MKKKSRPQTALIVIEHTKAGGKRQPRFVESLTNTLRLRGYTDVIHANPTEALALVEEGSTEVTTICMNGVCPTQRKIREIIIPRGCINLVFMPPSHNATLGSFGRFLDALECSP